MARPSASWAPRSGLRELARAARCLRSRWQLTLAVGESLEEATTSLMARACFLPERLADPLSAWQEAQELALEAERNARLARALLGCDVLETRTPPRLGDLLCALARRLPELLGERYGVELSPLAQGAHRRVHPELQELLLLMLQRACRCRPEGGRLRLGLTHDDSGGVRIELSLEAPSGGEAAPAWRSPAAPDQLCALGPLAAELGAELSTRLEPRRLSVRLRLPG